jgi:hypothetical protein
MATTLTAHAQIRDGRLFIADRRRFNASLATWRDCDVTVRVERKRKKRTDPQNRWLHGVGLKLIAEECGYDRHELDQLRYDLLGLCFGTETNALGLEVPKVRSSKALDTEQFSQFMDWLVRFAADKLNLRIPLPDDPICLDIMAQDEAAA